MVRFPMILAIMLCLLGALLSAATAAAAEEQPWEEGRWYPLFDGKSLDGWKSTQFGGEGEVTVDMEKRELLIARGAPMSGITYASEKKLPVENYEIRLEAKRTQGGDFFCGLTVPYRDSHFSLIVGGWGGGVIGISSIDGMDASENKTTSYQAFKNNVWHKVRLRVQGDRVDAWIDDKQVVDLEIGDHKLSTRVEVDLSKPLGISTYDTGTALRNLELRRLPVTSEPNEKP